MARNKKVIHVNNGILFLTLCRFTILMATIQVKGRVMKENHTNGLTVFRFIIMRHNILTF